MFILAILMKPVPFLDDESRVILDDGGSDYMNASYIEVTFKRIKILTASTYLQNM